MKKNFATSTKKPLPNSLIFSVGFRAILQDLVKFYDVIKKCFATFWMLISV